MCRYKGSLLPAASSVAFVKNDLVTSADKRAELEQEWNDEIASPLAAAAYGVNDKILRDIYVMDAEIKALYSYLFGEGGVALVSVGMIGKTGKNAAAS